MSAHKKIEEKAREIEQSLEEWAQKEGVLEAGQSIEFSLRVVSAPLVRGNINLGKEEKRENLKNSRLLDYFLTKEDWGGIMSNAFPDSVENHLQRLKKSTIQTVDGCSNVINFVTNGWLKKMGLPYRIFQTKRMTDTYRLYKIQA